MSALGDPRAAGDRLELGVHLPQLDLGGGGPSRERLLGTVTAARAVGAVALSANDHFAFGVPWLDGLAALTAVAASAGDLELMTTVSLPALRGPLPLAASLAALSRLAEGPVVAGVGPGSSAADHRLLDQPFDERWARFDVAVRALRTLLAGPGPGSDDLPGAVRVARSAVPVWVGSWGSAAGLRRVARLGDGWLASAYHQTPETFGTALRTLDTIRGTSGPALPHAVVTMWLRLTGSRDEADDVLGRLGRLLRTDPDELRGRVCVGPVEHCAALLDAYVAAGCRRVHVWPVGDEPRQLEELVARVLPQVRPVPRRPS